MRLTYFKGKTSNFGDDLNEWLWPKLLPDFFDDDPSVLFIGIGSILGAPYPADSKKIVFGSGYVPGYYEGKPDLNNDDWDVFFVRGADTTQSFDLEKELAIGDSAILIRALDLKYERNPVDIGYMPHWESLPRGNWQAACRKAGIKLIDPRDPVEDIIKQILQCKVIVCEAMHGAIVADSLRVPWISVLPLGPMNRAKWFDWANILQIELAQHRLWPSSPKELQLALERRPVAAFFAKMLNLLPISLFAKPLIVYVAAKRLAVISKKKSNLSSDQSIEAATKKMIIKLEELKVKYGRYH